VQSNAKKYAPVNLGQLRNSIQLKEELLDNKLVFTIGSKLSYAPYIEFGTGGKVSIPNGYSEFANQFRGKTGGTFAQLLKALVEWVKRKGIVATYSVKTGRRQRFGKKEQDRTERAAELIAFKILRDGVKARPFIYPSVNKNLPILLEDIKKVTKL
jgi:hypothetical protein